MLLCHLSEFQQFYDTEVPLTFKYWYVVVRVNECLCALCRRVPFYSALLNWCSWGRLPRTPHSYNLAKKGKEVPSSYWRPLQCSSFNLSQRRKQSLWSVALFSPAVKEQWSGPLSSDLLLTPSQCTAAPHCSAVFSISSPTGVSSLHIWGKVCFLMCVCVCGWVHFWLSVVKKTAKCIGAAEKQNKPHTNYCRSLCKSAPPVPYIRGVVWSYVTNHSSSFCYVENFLVTHYTVTDIKMYI